MRGFLTEAGIAATVAEADIVLNQGHRSFSKTNAYFTSEDESLPGGDPRRRVYDRSNAFIPADNFRPEGPLRTVFYAPGFDCFIRERLEEPEEGNGFPWHFDTNNFTVTLALQNAERGGAFEYAPNIRDSVDEHFDAVRAVLDGSSDRVRRLELRPGDLQIFRGRYSLHRVAPLAGARPRYVAIFSYMEEAGMVGRPERTKQLYGRVPCPFIWNGQVCALMR
ncbi:hypothetical protein N4R57_12925 [Rhodobacteraceae bacterium D3-12]|nr:hypothetical protein N4R57_12925 [Rhodobacteraceae bacterium D3-12]